MEDNVKERISQNIVNLRKQNKLTQLELSEKIAYSDKAISRWEKGESLPDLETLYKLSLVFDVPVSYFFEENVNDDTISVNQKNEKLSKILVLILSISIVWMVATIAYVYLKSFSNINYWQIFVWGVPASGLVLRQYNKVWGKKAYTAIISSLLIWSTITAIYCHYISYNLWIVFLIGPLVQAVITLKYVMKPIKIKNKNKRKLNNENEKNKN